MEVLLSKDMSRAGGLLSYGFSMQAAPNQPSPKLTLKMQREMREASLLAWLVHKALPFQCIDDDLFQYFLEQEGHTIRSSKYLTTKYLPIFAAFARHWIAEELSTTKFLSITTDGWTNIHLQKCCDLSFHFVDDSFERKSLLAAMIPLPFGSSHKKSCSCFEASN
jgi:hypothetical protein